LTRKRKQHAYTGNS